VDADRAALNRLPRWFVAALVAGPVCVLAVFYVWPLATLAATVLDAGSVRRTLHLPGLGQVVWFTLWQATVSTAATLAVGFVPAYVLARFRFPGRGALRALVTVPFMLPTVVVGAAFLALLPRDLHGTALAVVVAHVFFNVAVVVRLVGGMWAVLPHDLTAAARTLGASPAQLLRHVVLPLLRPALIASAAVVFLFTFTSFGVVTLLGGAARPTLEVEIARRATQLGDVDGAAVLALLQLVLLAVVVALAARWQRRAATSLTGDAGTRRPRRAGERLLVVLTALATTAAMATPMVVLVVRSLRIRGRWTLAAWRDLTATEVRPGISFGIDPLASLTVSLRLAVVATAISLAVGAVAALAIGAARRHGRLLDVGIMLPLGTSAVTIGLGMLVTFDTAPVDWRARWWLIPVGHALVAIPFVVRALLPVLRAQPADLRAAAATLGASPMRAWWAVDVRALRRPLLTGAGFAAAISLGEFGATTFLTRSGRETVPIAIGRLLGRTGDLPRAQAFALATMLLVATGAIIAAIDATERGATDARRA
jgi:thiamine transport system permease protein